ncbi:MAG: hypothetical protein M1611_00470 [Candidatus Marsarchaeota archaeon]|nr:hypothetical protein [Candidatus Marsarchaeota archaeon]
MPAIQFSQGDESALRKAARDRSPQPERQNISHRTLVRFEFPVGRHLDEMVRKPTNKSPLIVEKEISSNNADEVIKNWPVGAARAKLVTEVARKENGTVSVTRNEEKGWIYRGGAMYTISQVEKGELKGITGAAKDEVVKAMKENGLERVVQSAGGVVYPYGEGDACKPIPIKKNEGSIARQ